MRVFLDANILFSGAKSNGAVRALLARLVADGHTLVADGYVVAEVRRNLSAKGTTAIDALDELLKRVEFSAYRPARLPADLASLLPDKDHPVMAAAIRLGCDALVTGDRTHFGALYGSVRHGVAVHSPRSLAEAPRG
jgi:predicted nucleic acid-binding protein